MNIHRAAIIFLIFMIFAIPGLADTPSIAISPNTDPIVTAIGASQTWFVTSNQTVNISFLINGTQMKYIPGVTTGYYGNQSGGQGYWNLTINVNNSGGLNSTHINWTVANTPVISTSSTTGQAGAVDIVNSSRTFNISKDQITNISWQVNGVEVQYNTSVGAGLYVNYTNQSGRKGTWTVSAVVNNTNGTAYQNWTWSVSESTISGALVETNYTNINSSRLNGSVNSTLSFYLNDSSSINYVNVTAGDFTFSALTSVNVNTTTFPATTTTVSGNKIIIKDSSGVGANHTGMWVNLSANVKPPAAGVGAYPINLATDRNPTGTNVTVYVRNTSQPFFVKANNSVFAVASETFGDTTTTISLTGQGVSNLTFYAPNITAQTNITVGYGATNVTLLRAAYSGSNSTNNTIYVETDGTVTNPVITLSNVNELRSSNLPAGIVVAGGGLISVIIYVYRRRTRSR